jgi:polyhydroxyalkanoate synthesis regulator phasin
MNLDEQLQAMANSGHPTIVEIANRARELKAALEQGQCSPEEYKSMLTDLVHEANIENAISDLQTRQTTYQVLNGLLALASVV